MRLAARRRVSNCVMRLANRAGCRPAAGLRIAALGVALVGLGTIAGACGDDSADHSRADTSSTTAAARSPVVALGDSETTGSGDPTGVGWVGRYARLLHTKLGVEADVTNLAEDGKTSAELLSDMREDSTTREAVKGAQVVLLGIGGADLNEGDMKFEAGKCRAEACYAPVLGSFARNFDATVAAIRELRGPNNTVLRAITQPNTLTGAEDVIPPFLKPVATEVGVYQAKTANRSICQVMAKYDGRCVDLLEAFNGPDGTDNAYAKGLLNHEDCCYPSAKGQQLMAELLFATGLEPLR
jgi:lysophospholipase L1-like esterase